MRSHLIKCQEDGTISFSGRCSPASKKISLYCKCKMPEGRENMAYCPNCCAWYHQTYFVLLKIKEGSTSAVDVAKLCTYCTLYCILI